MRHAAPVVFPVDFDGGKHVYRVHPINVQLVTDLVMVIMVQNVLTNTIHVKSCIVMFKYVIKVSLLQKEQNDRIKNIVSVFYSIQCSLSATIMTNSCQDHSTSASKTVRIHHKKGCVARCEVSNDGVHEPRLVSWSYGIAYELVLPPGA